MKTASFDGLNRKRRYSASGLPYHVRVQRYSEEKNELLYNAQEYSAETLDEKIKELARKWRV